IKVDEITANLIREIKTGRHLPIVARLCGSGSFGKLVKEPTTFQDEFLSNIEIFFHGISTLQ
ncbi:9351_t:CDS:1, partial [Funneliformis caledonium]